MATKRTAPSQTLAKADDDGNAVKLNAEEGRPVGFLTARMHIDPAARHAVLGITATGEFFGGEAGKAGVGDHIEALTDAINKVAAGDLSAASRTMAAQAVSLDALFTQMVRRASLNLASYPDAAERYMRLAFKAQAQSRSTFEALIGLHQPREQVVRHVHVHEGGQAVVAEEFHHHAPGAGHAGNDEQAHASRTAGTGERASLPCPDPLRNGMSIAGSAGQASMPHARRSRGQRRPDRQ